MFNLLQTSKYPTEMLYFLTEHSLIIYVQYTKRFQEKNFTPLREIIRKDFEHFVSNSIFKRLIFDYSSSETVLIQRINLSAIFLVTAHSWRSDQPL